MRRCSSGLGPTCRAANGTPYVRSPVMRCAPEGEASLSRPPPLSQPADPWERLALQSAWPTWSLVPERFRGGFAPSAPSGGGPLDSPTRAYRLRQTYQPTARSSAEPHRRGCRELAHSPSVARRPGISRTDGLAPTVRWNPVPRLNRSASIQFPRYGSRRGPGRDPTVIRESLTYSHPRGHRRPADDHARGPPRG